MVNKNLIHLVGISSLNIRVTEFKGNKHSPNVTLKKLNANSNPLQKD